jgi:tetratricopeptide (TPR) repeat protein
LYNNNSNNNDNNPDIYYLLFIIFINFLIFQFFNFKILFVGGLTDDPVVLVGIAKSLLGLEDYEEASRAAQKAIQAAMAAGAANASIEAYVVRAAALQATGCTDLAAKHLTAALSRDPDNHAIQMKLKALRKTVSATERVRQEVDTAMNARSYEIAISKCADGLQIDKDCKKLVAEFHARRAKAYSMLAKLQLHTHQPGPDSPDSTETDPKAVAGASWRRCLQVCYGIRLD